jgi:hypothetical protein
MTITGKRKTMEGFEPKRSAADPAAAENLKHLARLLDQGVPLNLKINGRRVAMPTDANFAINLDRDPRSGCVEVDIRWTAQFENEKSSADAGTSPENAGALPGNAGAPACMSAKHENNDGHLKDRKITRRAVSSGGPHIRLKALITAPKI